MKICHLTSAHPPFDVRIFFKECRSLVRAGHDVTLIAPADFKEQNVDGVRILGIPPPGNRRERSRTWSQLIKTVRRLKPDLVHFHDPDLLLLTPLLRRYPLVYDCHERNAVAMLNKPWLPNPLSYVAYLLVGFLEPALARLVNGIIIVDESQIATFRNTGKPVTLIRNYPIVPEKISSQGDRHPHALVHVGANARSRGCTVMIEAFALVLKQVPDAELWLVGPFNHPPYEKETRELIFRRGLQAKVCLVGEVSYPEALDWVAKSSIGLIAYQAVPQYERCLPTKVLEYMASGIPIVASDVPANRDIIAPAGCGLLVDPADPDAYATAITGLLKNPVTAAQLGKKGRQAVLSNFDWGLENEKLLNFYLSLFTPRQPPDVSVAGRKYYVRPSSNPRSSHRRR